jgi:hypothetical protein
VRGSQDELVATIAGGVILATGWMRADAVAAPFVAVIL